MLLRSPRRRPPLLPLSCNPCRFLLCLAVLSLVWFVQVCPTSTRPRFPLALHMSWLVSDPASPLLLSFVGRAGSETSHAATPPGKRETRARATDHESVAKSVARPPSRCSRSDPRGLACGAPYCD